MGSVTGSIERAGCERIGYDYGPGPMPQDSPTLVGAAVAETLDDVERVLAAAGRGR